MQKLIIPLVALILGTAPIMASANPETELDAFMAGFHEAAAQADFDDYFNRFTDDAVFLGTDASERWPVEDFKAYAKPRFDQGGGWTYQTIERHWKVAGDVAWFDEILSNEFLGRCRGTGVAVKTNGEWQLSHYSLTMLIPNEIAEDVAQQASRVTSMP